MDEVERVLDRIESQSAVALYSDVVRGRRDHSKMTDNRDSIKGFKLSYHDQRDEEVVISLDEVVPERNYWSLAVIGYVLGENVPFSAMDGVVNNAWSRVVKPKVLHEQGFYIFCFENLEEKLSIMEGSWFFNRKPLQS